MVLSCLYWWQLRGNLCEFCYVGSDSFYMYGLKISDVVAKNFGSFFDRVLCRGNFTEIYLKLKGLSILNNE